MSARGVRRSRREEEEESYFISMADMMVGLLFIFVILVVYFAIQFQQKSKALSDAGEVRAQILTKLRDAISERDPRLRVNVDTRTGVLTLPASILFAKGAYELSPQGVRAIGTVAEAMSDVLPCYAYPRRRQNCDATSHSIDAIFVEGHTDADPLNGAGPISDNMDLSALRATNTFRAMKSAAPALSSLHNSQDRPILSVSGYGADRPVSGNRGNDEAAKSLNRRIDLRFLMETPRVEGLAAMLTSGR